MDETGRQGMESLERIHTFYSRFTVYLHQARREGMALFNHTTLQTHSQLLNLVDEGLDDLMTPMVESIHLIQKAHQIGQGFDTDMAEHNGLQLLPDARERRVSKVFGFFKRDINGTKNTEVSRWLRYVPMRFIGDTESLIENIKAMELVGELWKTPVTA